MQSDAAIVISRYDKKYRFGLLPQFLAQNFKNLCKFLSDRSEKSIFFIHNRLPANISEFRLVRR